MNGMFNLFFLLIPLLCFGLERRVRLLYRLIFFALLTRWSKKRQDAPARPSKIEGGEAAGLTEEHIAKRQERRGRSIWQSRSQQVVSFLVSGLIILTAPGIFAIDSAEPPKTTYSFSNEPIDVVIPCIRKDLYSLEKCIEGIKKNGNNVRRVIVVSSERLTHSAEWFDENLFPFSKKDLAVEIFHGDEQRAVEFLRTPNCRIGWILQQCLKFYAPFVIPGISSNVLILDADVVFLNSTEFQNASGGPYFIPAVQYHRPYFEHAARLLPWLKRVDPSLSGISHHMLFQRPILEDLFSWVVLEHGMEPWKAICRCVDPADLPSCMSEYEIYFNFTFLRCYQAALHRAKWIEILTFHYLFPYQQMGYVFVACHEWQRK